jgi:membrane-associated phospholipid phosphatase
VDRLSISLLVLGLVCVLSPRSSLAQSETDKRVLIGLAPVTLLQNSPAGQTALAANYVITSGIQAGEIRQPTLLPFAYQQQQALQDAFITNKNFANLADGLGTTLGAAYLARFHYLDRTNANSMPAEITNVFNSANQTTYAHSNLAKFFFANGTKDGTVPVSGELLAIITASGGKLDVFGSSYGCPAKCRVPDPFGNSRPFQTEPTTLKFSGLDYFGAFTDNGAYNSGPLSDLTLSPSYPSGHTTYGYGAALLLAILVPSRYQQMIVRAAEYGNDRILMGAHYAMDVIAGRALATYDVAQMLATPDFQNGMSKARRTVAALLATACGETVEACANQDSGRFSNAAASAAFYGATQTYNLPVVYPDKVGKTEDVEQIAPEAGCLLVAAFPKLSLHQADEILTDTEGPGGGFLDADPTFGVYSRLNLYAAAGKAALVAPRTSADDDAPVSCPIPLHK